ncbi:alpha-L-rhamnosidase [Lewinella aquimaris]|uniref:alpha-L-rhamnosidase n=1 Tax=Neolewinella aquimaris TaxID=1835722 RepID=A0A840E675_9BACT|nr:alpha-L-rhamnosidase [Neolewinella aquimaris]MBB4080681.1 alpha-L-rhamnosidase [Neolewinella aquimaris]
MRFLLLLLFLGLGIIHAQDVSVTNLRFEQQENTLGVGEIHPRLSWQLQSDQRDIMQTAYQIRVAASEADLVRGRRLIHDSGKVDSDASVLVDYAGPAAGSREQRVWQVRAWTGSDQPTEWSQPARWETGLLEPADWTAEWIEPDLTEAEDRSMPAPLLRREFDLGNNIVSARLYITAHGVYEAKINGKRVGDLLLTPGWTVYDERLQYQTYDVTDHLRSGPNAIGVALGDGWYRGYLAWADARNHYGTKLGLLAQLEVTYRNGKTERITTDGDWRAGTGAIRSSDIYNGEVYDARREQSGWTEPGFSAENWAGVRVADHSKEILVAPVGPGVRVTETLDPVELIVTPEGDTVLDFSQNLVGRVAFSVSGPAGTTVTVEHAEVLDKEGNFYTTNLRAAKQRIDYTLAGGAEETFRPQFTFMGFRYIRVKGWPGTLSPDRFTAEVIHSDMRPTGTFTCSDSLINQLQRNIQWGQRGNFVDVPTDCPQRDERLGWTGDAQAFARTATFNYDVSGFFQKWLKDLAADQLESGSVPFVIPHVLGANAAGAAGWADVATIAPWTMYLAYGDRRILEEQYPSMQAWVGYMEEKAGESMLWNTGFHFGDWLFYSANDDNDGRSAVTDKYLIAQSFFVYSTDLLARTAEILGKTADATRYRELAKQLREAYLHEYVTPGGRLVSSTQTAYVLALHFDILPEDLREQAARRLVENVRSYGHLTTGFLGTPYLLEVLTRFGYLDDAYQLLERKEYPSWLYPVTRGATTIWERWDGIKPDSTFQAITMNSFNHYAYGAVGDWLYRTVAGLDTDASEPGYRRLKLRPRPGGSLTDATAELLTPYGPAASGWQLSDAGLTVNITVPPNTTAELVLPDATAERVELDGELLTGGNGVHEVQQTDKNVTVLLGSGSYRFFVPTALGK